MELVLLILRRDEREVGKAVFVALDGGDDGRDARMELRFGGGQRRLDLRRDLRGADRLGQLGAATRFRGVELGDDVVARLLHRADQDRLRVVVSRLNDSDRRRLVVVVRNDDEGRRYSGDRQHAHRGDRDDSLRDPGRQKCEHYETDLLEDGLLWLDERAVRGVHLRPRLAVTGMRPRRFCVDA